MLICKKADFALLNSAVSVLIDEPQRGFTTKPGVDVTTAHPRKNETKPRGPQRGSTSQLLVWVQASGDVEPPLWFGSIPTPLPGVRRSAATPGFAVKPVPG